MNKLSKREQIRSCGIVIVRKENDKYKFLILRSGGYNECGPKGKREKNETDFETAMRETKEETGLTPDDLDFRWGKEINYTTEPYTKYKNKTATFFLAEITKEQIKLPFNPELGKKEHDAYYWLTYDEAKKVVVPRISKVLDWANKIIEQQ